MAKMTVILPPDLHRAIRHLCVDLGISFQALALHALQDALARHDAKKKTTREKR